MVSLTLLILIAVAFGFIAVGGVTKSQDLFNQAKDKADTFRRKGKGD